MPTYQYRCKQCGHELEIVQSFSDEPLDTCPECQGALKKVYGNVGISFKGSGFYKTDSRGGGSSKKTEKATTSSDSGTSTATKTESSGASSGDKAASPATTSSTSKTSSE